MGGRKVREALPSGWEGAVSAGRGGSLLRVRVSPRSSREGVEAAAGGELVVRLNAPPVEGKANRALTKLLARELGLAPSRLEVVRGERSRSKVVLVRGWPASKKT